MGGSLHTANMKASENVCAQQIYSRLTESAMLQREKAAHGGRPFGRLEMSVDRERGLRLSDVMKGVVEDGLRLEAPIAALTYLADELPLWGEVPPRPEVHPDSCSA